MDRSKHIPQKRKLILFLLGITFLGACSQKPEYFSFSPKYLAFVPYTKNDLHLILHDTSGVVKSLQLTAFERRFTEQRSIYGGTNDHYEEYSIFYKIPGFDPEEYMDVRWNLSNFPGPHKGDITLTLNRYEQYQFLFDPDTIEVSYPEIKIEGYTYKDVYELTGYYQGHPDAESHNPFSAVTIKINQEYGLLELLFPDNKHIVREFH